MSSAGGKIKAVLDRLGFKADQNNRVTVVPLMAVGLGLALAANTFRYIVDGKEIRGRTDLLMAAKDINLILTATASTFQFTVRKESLRDLVGLIEWEFPKHSSAAQTLAIDRCLAKQNKTLYATAVLLAISYFSMAFLPGAVGVSLILKNGIGNVKIADLPLPLKFCYPGNYEAIQIYAAVFVLQSLFLFYPFCFGYCVFGSITGSLQSIATEAELLCMDLVDVGPSPAQLRHLVTSHRRIHQSVKKLTCLISLPITLINQCICFEICIFLYCAAEVDSILPKVSYCTSALALSITVLIYYDYGEQIIKSGENIRNSLYTCLWEDKPQWFKKDLEIMMAIAVIPINIKPLGLYILDLKTYTNLMNAAYTYFNVLRNLKN